MIATIGLATAAFLDAAPAQAQASGCEKMQTLLQERQSLVASLNAAQKSKRKLTPQQACSTMGKLVSNGATTVKFATDNQDWCQIPPSFIDGMKADNQKAATIRNQACNAVKQQAEMMRRAQQQAQGSGNPFGGGDSITGGGMRIPQGAL
ncbi:hypothetical protein [Bosea sp. AAP35]|uniref:hypothetical protein n=1 Tax=Bosea sp. AAP35 TaxID=1523417 RepID=UPI0006B8C77D|nr:hypothetical protein [Bosea sp. AAP35]